jgi:RNA polymerase sigma factor (sigma-70 family)
MVGTALIEKLRSDGQEELNRIYKGHREEFIFWINKSYQVPIDDAKDIYQFSILKLYENVLSGQLTTLNSSLKTYLFAIGKNKALEYHRAMAKRVNPAFDLYLEIDSEDSRLKEEQLQSIEKGLQELGEPCSTLLTLYYYQRQTMETITQTLGYKNANTAKNQKYKCLQRLKKLSLVWSEKLSLS